MNALKPVLRPGTGRLQAITSTLKEAWDQLFQWNTYASILQSCVNIEQLKQVHAHIITNGFHQDIFLQTKLVGMYAVFSSMENAHRLFDRIEKPDVLVWNEMIKGYACNGPCEEALPLYYQMQRAHVLPNNFTFPFVLKACASLLALQEGMKIHEHIVRSRFESCVFVQNALVDMYAKCGNLEIARQLFDKMSERDVVSWNAMIAGYAQNGLGNEALMLFDEMQRNCVKPNLITFKSVLPACAQLSALQQGKWIHECIIKSRMKSDVIVETALVDMYAKCGRLGIARELFDKMPKRNVFSWSAMISGYAQGGRADEALALFQQMRLTSVMLDSVAVLSVIPACAHLAALQQGKSTHGYAIRNIFESRVTVGNALIDMYAKCGNVEIARQFFDRMAKRDVISWNVMIAGYGMHGHGNCALKLFSKMQQSSVEPSDVTFLCILSACSHAGLVNEGWQCFDSMRRDYCIMPRLQHYACIVDLFGRAGQLEEAEEFIKKMPIKPDAGVWGALLGACKIHCNIELAEHVAGHIFELEPWNPGYYVLLSNIYAVAGKWSDVANVRRMMKARSLKKPPGWSFIEVNHRVHTFYVGDRSHPRSEEIYAMLESLAGQMKEAGYSANTDAVLHNVEDEEKEQMLGSHSEKLAIAFGLITTNPDTPIQITKNLRVCDDCHSATKFISMILRRQIIVRDANRFHHFKDGLCSCRDYW